MRLVSWNLFGLEDEDLDARTEAAVFTALLGDLPARVFTGEVAPREPPEVLMLQEVVDRALVAHLGPHLQAAGYQLVHSSRDRSYYEVIAVRAPVAVVDHRVVGLDSLQGRELLVVEAMVDGVPWRLVTGHLESLVEGSARRLAQSRVVLDLLATAPGPAVFAGDTNLRDAEADTLDAVDAWTACGADRAHRWTYFSERSGRKARYDRIWGHRVAFAGFATGGRDPVTEQGQPASDHALVEVALRPR